MSVPATQTRSRSGRRFAGRLSCSASTPCTWRAKACLGADEGELGPQHRRDVRRQFCGDASPRRLRQRRAARRNPPDPARPV